jgi:hypothetical protein
MPMAADRSITRSVSVEGLGQLARPLADPSRGADCLSLGAQELEAALNAVGYKFSSEQINLFLHMVSSRF